MKYLGGSFTATGQAFGEIKAHFNVARAAVNRLQSSLWSRPDISHRTEGRIYESVVWIILLYGCETWPLRVEDPMVRTCCPSWVHVVSGKNCLIAFVTVVIIGVSLDCGQS